MSIFLGIDIGTTKICVLAYDSVTRKPVVVLSETNASTVKIKKEFAEQNPVVIKQITFRLIDKIKKQIKSPVSGIGVTGQMHGMLIVDKNLNPLTNLVTWQDKRATELIPEIHKKTGSINYRECGCRIRPGYMGATLYWYHKTRSMPKTAYKTCFIHDWIAASLTEQREICTDPSDAASSGIYDISKLEWHSGMINKLGIDKKLLPELKPSGTVIGQTKDGIPVGCAFGDNQASIYGSIVASGFNWKDCIVLNIGTGSQVSVITDKFTKVDGMLELRPYLDNKYLIVGASVNGGISYSLLRDFIIGLEYEQMNKFADCISPGSDGLVCNPYFFGERGNEQLKASFTGIDKNNFTVAHVCRAVLEGMTRMLYNYYKDMNQKRNCIIGSGNAVKRNDVLQKIVQQTFGMKLKLNKIEEEAATGAAILSSRLSSRA
jgi:sedoheptulokinase